MQEVDTSRFKEHIDSLVCLLEDVSFVLISFLTVSDLRFSELRRYVEKKMGLPKHSLDGYKEELLKLLNVEYSFVLLL